MDRKTGANEKLLESMINVVEKMEHLVTKRGDRAYISVGFEHGEERYTSLRSQLHFQGKPPEIFGILEQKYQSLITDRDKYFKRAIVKDNNETEEETRDEDSDLTGALYSLSEYLERKGRTIVEED